MSIKLKFFTISFFLIIFSFSCSSLEEDYYKKISNLTNGEYYGNSYTKSEQIGSKQPKAEAIIYFDYENLSKKYEYYEPLIAETGVVFGWDGPQSIKESGVIESQNIIWSTKTDRLVIVGDWLETSSGATATFNISPILFGDDAGKIYASMFTDYWEVWGFKEIDKKDFNILVDLFREYYKETHNNEEPWNKSEIKNNNENSGLVKDSTISDVEKNTVSDTSSLKTKDRIKFKIANTSFTLEFISETEGKIYYDNGIGFTTIKYSDKLPNGNLVWEETDGQTKTGAYTFKDSNLESGAFTRYKDNKKFDFTRIKE